MKMKYFSVYLDATIPASHRFVWQAETAAEAESAAVADWREIILGDPNVPILDPDYLVICARAEQTTEIEYLDLSGTENADA